MNPQSALRVALKERAQLRIGSKQPCEKLDRYLAKLEVSIAKDAYASFIYADQGLLDRFPQGEPVVQLDPYYAYLYAVRVLKERWTEEVEQRIKLAIPFCWEDYRSIFGIKGKLVDWRKEGF